MNYTVPAGFCYNVRMNVPVYTIHDRAIDLVAQIAEKVGALKAVNLDLPDLHLRKASRIRSVYSSLAIE